MRLGTRLVGGGGAPNCFTEDNITATLMGGGGTDRDIIIRNTVLALLEMYKIPRLASL